MTEPASRPSPFERLLNLFAEVRRGEGGTVLLLMLNVFLLLSTYYIIKPVREALILAIDGGAELKAYMSAGQGFLLLFAVPLYGAIAARASRRKLINVVTLFFAACLVGFYLLAQANLPLGVVFYLWVGIFNLMVIAQFWAFANDLYTPDQGKRLFAIVGFGASAGAVAGSWVSSKLSGLGESEMLALLLVAAGILAVSLVVTNVIDARERRRARRVAPGPDGAQVTETQADASTAEDESEGGAEAGDDGHPAEEEPITSGGPLRAFQLVLQHRYLLLIALLILFLNWVNTTGEYILGRVVKDAMSARVATGDAGGVEVGPLIGAFYGDFFFWVNIVSMTVQLFLVSRILKYLGVRVALLILPVIALGGYLTVMLVPILGYVRWVKTAENATDYSLQNTLRGVLFLPTTREQKYMGKQAIDTIFVRAGDTLQALTVFVGTTYLAFGTREFAAFNAVLVLVWIGLAIAVGTRYQKLTAGR